MDLYRTLRVSLYLLVGTGALAISVAEHSVIYLILTAVLALLSYLLIDSGKLKPLSPGVTTVLMTVVLYMALRPPREEEFWQYFPMGMAHFLCVWQGMLFFSVYSGPILLSYCGSTLAIVVMSGVAQSGPSLLARVACFIAVAVWTLYIHAVWRSRQEFAGLPTLLSTQDAKASGERSGLERLRRLPEGSFWGTVMLVAGLSGACLGLGVLIFFSAPRVDGIMAFFDRRGSGSESKNEAGLLAVGHDPSGATFTGDSDRVKLRNLGRISLDSRVALKVMFTKPLGALAGNKNRLLLKGGNFAEYSDGQWLPELRRRTLESRGGGQITVDDPSLDGAVRARRDEWVQTVETVGLHSRSLYAAGPAVRVDKNARKVEIDEEGSLRSAENTVLQRYTLGVVAPNRPAELWPGAVADHRAAQRYIVQTGLSPSEREDVSQLARRITRGISGDANKARAIQLWLEAQRVYSLNLDEIHPQGDPVAHFLLTKEPAQARGHCGLFASGFVMLCRLNNMPARLCTGYAARVESAETQTTVEARNSDAHAWAEIYFKGIGWTTYDPTPAAPLQEREPDIAAVQPSRPAQPTNNTAATAGPAIVESESQGVVQEAWDSVMNYNSREQRKLFEKISGTQTGGGGLLSGKGWGGWIGAALAWTAIAAALAWLVQLFAKRTARRKFAQSGGGMRAKAAVAFYNDLLAALSRRGYSRQPGQTPREFAEAVLRRGGAAFAPVREVTEIFEAVRYGGGELEQEEFNRLHEALDKIKEMTF